MTKNKWYKYISEIKFKWFEISSFILYVLELVHLNAVNIICLKINDLS